MLRRCGSWRARQERREWAGRAVGGRSDGSGSRSRSGGREPEREPETDAEETEVDLHEGDGKEVTQVMMHDVVGEKTKYSPNTRIGVGVTFGAAGLER